MDISVVILSWNSNKYIRTCLTTLLEDLDASGQQYEVFIVDNGSIDGTREELAIFESRYPGRIKPIYLATNTGTTYSRNLAIKQASGRIVVVMDSDIRVPRGAIGTLIERLYSSDRIGMVVPALYYPSGNLQKSTDRFPTLPSKVTRFFFLKHIEAREFRTHISVGVRDVEYAISAFWVLKREVMERIGLFDERIFYAPEDVDYCLRVWKGGYRIILDQNVAVTHDAQEISRGFRINRAKIQHLLGLIYYFRKHHYLFIRPHYSI